MEKIWCLSMRDCVAGKPPTTVCIFDRRDCYVAVEDSAFFIAKEILKSQSFLKKAQVKEMTINYANLNRNQFERVVKDALVVHQYRVELYKQSHGNEAWELQCKATPGNVSEFEDVLSSYADIQDQNRVLAFKIAGRSGSHSGVTVSVACCELLSYSFRVCQIADNDHLTNLQCVLMQLLPRECISLPANSALPTSLESIFRSVSIPLTVVKADHFDSTHLFDNLNKLLKFKHGSKGSCEILPETDQKETMQCVAALIKYLELMNCDSNMHLFSLETLDLGQCLRVDCAAFSSLNLLKPGAVQKGYDTLYGVLNHCQTASGERLLEQWLKMPLLNKDKINERLDIVQCFVDHSDLRIMNHQSLLCRFPDLHKLCRLLLRKRVGLADVYKMYRAVVCIPKLLNAFKEVEDNPVIVENFIQPLRLSNTEFSRFTQMVETTVDLDAYASTRELQVKADFDEELKSLHKNMEKVQAKAEKCFAALDLAKDKKMKLMWSDQLGYFCRARNDKMIRNRSDLKILAGVKQGVRFATTEMAELTTKMSFLKEQYSVAQQKVVDAIAEIAVGYMDPLLRFADLIAYLDVLTAFSVAAVSAPIPYVRPKILEKGSGCIKLVDARHPCVERQGDISFISNDLTLSRGEAELIVLTGPNMGGKSTYLRQVAVIVIMAQVGSFVPAAEAVITVIDCILTRIGAADNLFKGLSTFMMEMIEATKILEVATRDSLVLIDELGRGTSTYDGLSLSWAIAEDIAKRIHCFCLFASHFQELTLLADEIETVRNFHVAASFTNDQLVLLYKVTPGSSNKSYGISVAKMVQFPEEVILDAMEEEKKLNCFSMESDERKSALELIGAIKKEMGSKGLDDSVASSLLPYINCVEKELTRFSTDLAE